MSRIFGKNQSIEYARVEGFWERRSERVRELGAMRACMFGPDEEFTRRRDMIERETVLPVLGISKNSRVLDIGCGIGRWGQVLAPAVGSYLGIDPCKGFLDIAQEAFDTQGFPSETHRLQLLHAQHVSEATVALPPPFDLVVIAGVLHYLNDEDITGLLGRLSHLMAKKSTVYVRGPIALDERLTVLEHFSEDLGDYYHAIYRTIPEHEALFKKMLPSFTVSHSRHLYPDELCNRKETAQHFFILQNTDMGTD